MLFFVFAMSAGGCGSTQEPAPQDRSERFANVLIDSASEFEREILEDRYVTAAEYERGVLAAKTCMEEAGIAVEGPDPIYGDVVLSFTFDEARFDEARMDACVEEFLNAVEWVWIDQNLPTGAEREELKENLFLCLQADNIDIEGLSTEDEGLHSAIIVRIQEHQAAGGQGTGCLDEHGLLWITPFDTTE